MTFKSFKERVKEHLRSESWNIQYTSIPFIDFFSVRRGAHLKKAYRVKAHGHLKKAEIETLCEYGRVHKIHVIYIHEVADRGLEFIRLYPKNLKTEAV